MKESDETMGHSAKAKAKALIFGFMVYVFSAEASARQAFQACSLEWPHDG
jgi:hypothetical protein